MANLLDAMLAEAEAALATPDRREILDEQVPKEATSESPLPPPTSVFASAAVSPPARSAAVGAATACSGAQWRAPGACSAHKGAMGGRAEDLASKLERRRQWEHECEPATSDAGAIYGSANTQASPAASASSCGALSVRSADKACPDAGTRSYGEHAGRGKENHGLPDTEHTLARQTPLVCGSAVKALSEKEFKEKVDRKIAYFETLARESRLRKEEDAAAEQSLLEARSRIEASAAKRQSIHKSVSSAAWLQEDVEQAQCRLVFGHGCLSLTDLSDNAGSYEAAGEHEEDYLLPTGALAEEEPSSSLVTLTEPASPSVETASEPNGRKSMVANGTNSVFGISPVLETNTPDVEGTSTSSPTFQKHDQQHIFEGSESRACPEECAEEEHVDSDATAPAENVCAEGSSVSDAAAIRTKTWAGALACPTPTRASYHSVPASDATRDEHLPVEPDRPRDTDHDHTTLILGRLDSFLGSLRSPYGATPQEILRHESSNSEFSLTDDSREGGKETASFQTVHETGQVLHALHRSSDMSSQNPASDASAKAQSVDAGEDMKRQRAADKRAAFLASMNKIMEDQPVAAAMTRGCENGAEQEADDKHLLQAVELRAQRLSDIASCDISLSSATCNKSFGSIVQLDSNSSINRVSPVLMTSQDGETGIHSIKAVDMAGETSDTKASLGSSNQPFLSPNSSQYAASASKSSDSASSLLHPTDAGQITCPVAHGSSASRASEQSAGIGIQVKRVRGLITVVDLMPDGPAAEKLTKGQIVLQIDGEGELRCGNLVRMAHAALTEVVSTKQIQVGYMPHPDFWSDLATGLATLPFKSVLAKFRGRPGSTVSLSVVDTAMAFKSGLASRTIEVQRFLAPARTRRQTLAAQASEKAAPDPTASTPPQADTEKCKPAPFAEWPRAELSQDSGLCSPYSDPGDAFSDKKRRAASSRADVAESKEGPASTSGAISIDALHSRLLERLMGSVGSGAVPSAASNQNIDESAISGPVSSVCLATPTHEFELTPLAADANRNPKRRGSTSAQEQEEKFRCLLATTSYGPSAKPITLTTAVALCSERGGGPAASFSRRSGEFGKRVRSPNAAQPPTRSDKRMRHEQTTDLSLYSSAPGRVHADESMRSRPSRSTGPRKPAVGTTRRPASAPKSRPESHERNTVGGQPQTAPCPAPSLRKSRLSVTMLAHSSRSLAPGSASNPATSNVTRNPVRAFSSKGSKTASSSPARNVRAGPVTSLRTRRSEEGGERSGVARQKSLDNSLQVYADVGRAVTSFVQKLYKTPDPNRYPAVPF
jgi:hypothetical protein